MPELATFSSSVADILRNRFSKQAFLNAEFPDYHDSGRCVVSSLARTFFPFLKKYLIWTIDFDPVPSAVPPRVSFLEAMVSPSSGPCLSHHAV